MKDVWRPLSYMRTEACGHHHAYSLILQVRVHSYSACGACPRLIRSIFTRSQIWLVQLLFLMHHNPIVWLSLFLKDKLQISFVSERYMATNVTLSHIIWVLVDAANILCPSLTRKASLLWGASLWLWCMWLYFGSLVAVTLHCPSIWSSQGISVI